MVQETARMNEQYRPYNPDVIEAIKRDLGSGVDMAASRFIELPMPMKPLLVVDLLYSFHDRDLGLFLAGLVNGAIAKHYQQEMEHEP